MYETYLIQEILKNSEQNTEQYTKQNPYKGPLDFSYTPYFHQIFLGNSLKPTPITNKRNKKDHKTDEQDREWLPSHNFRGWY